MTETATKKENAFDRKRTFRQAFLDSLPVMAGYVVLGLGYGLIMETSGYSFLWAMAMSIFVFAGSMQYVTVSLLTGGASLITTGLMTLMINARHFFYGISMLGKYKDMGKEKPLLIHTLVDETYSLVCTRLHDEEWFDEKKYYLYISLLNWSYWVVASAAGGIAGTFITFDTTGIDFAMTALFAVIFTEQWLSTKEHLPALTGLGASIICLLVFGPNRFLIPAMALISAVLLLLRKRLEEK